jgi:hypothetical protein
MKRTEFVQLKTKVEKLEDDLSELTFRMDNPPKYKYGDIISIITSGKGVIGPETKVEIKILNSTLKRDDYQYINVVTYYWLYTIDIVGIGVKEITEYYLQQLKEGKIKIDQI